MWSGPSCLVLFYLLIWFFVSPKKKWKIISIQLYCRWIFILLSNGIQHNLCAGSRKIIRNTSRCGTHSQAQQDCVAISNLRCELKSKYTHKNRVRFQCWFLSTSMATAFIVMCVCGVHALNDRIPSSQRRWQTATRHRKNHRIPRTPTTRVEKAACICHSNEWRSVAKISKSSSWTMSPCSSLARISSLVLIRILLREGKKTTWKWRAMRTKWFYTHSHRYFAIFLDSSSSCIIICMERHTTFMLMPLFGFVALICVVRA